MIRRRWHDIFIPGAMRWNASMCFYGASNIKWSSPTSAPGAHVSQIFWRSMPLNDWEPKAIYDNCYALIIFSRAKLMACLPCRALGTTFYLTRFIVTAAHDYRHRRDCHATLIVENRIDILIRPHIIYQYRLRIKMSNYRLHVHRLSRQ